MKVKSFEACKVFLILTAFFCSFYAFSLNALEMPLYNDSKYSFSIEKAKPPEFGSGCTTSNYEGEFKEIYNTIKNNILVKGSIIGPSKDCENNEKTFTFCNYNAAKALNISDVGQFSQALTNLNSEISNLKSKIENFQLVLNADSIKETEQIFALELVKSYKALLSANAGPNGVTEISEESATEFASYINSVITAEQSKENILSNSARIQDSINELIKYDAQQQEIENNKIQKVSLQDENGEIHAQNALFKHLDQLLTFGENIENGGGSSSDNHGSYILNLSNSFIQEQTLEILQSLSNMHYVTANINEITRTFISSAALDVAILNEPVEVMVNANENYYTSFTYLKKTLAWSGNQFIEIIDLKRANEESSAAQLTEYDMLVQNLNDLNSMPSNTPESEVNAKIADIISNLEFVVAKHIDITANILESTELIEQVQVEIGKALTEEARAQASTNNDFNGEVESVNLIFNKNEYSREIGDFYSSSTFENFINSLSLNLDSVKADIAKPHLNCDLIDLDADTEVKPFDGLKYPGHINKQLWQNITIRSKYSNLDNLLCLQIMLPDADAKLFCKRINNSMNPYDQLTASQACRVPKVCFDDTTMQNKFIYSMVGKSFACFQSGMETLFHEKDVCADYTNLSDSGNDVTSIPDNSGDSYADTLNNTEASINGFWFIQKSLSSVVFTLLVLFVMFFAIDMILKDQKPSWGQVFQAIIKMILVVYFSVGIGTVNIYDPEYDNKIVGTKPNDGITGLVVPVATSIMGEFGSLILNAAGEPGGLCQFSANQYKYGFKSFALWDALDCRFHSYIMGVTIESGVDDDCLANIAINDALNTGGGPGSSEESCNLYNFEKENSSGKALTLLAIKFLLSGIFSWFLGITIFITCFILMFVNIVSIIMINLISIYILAFLAPIMVPMALFSQTKGYFDSYVSRLISFTLQPLALVGFLGIILTVYDSSMYNGCEFTQGESPEGKIFYSMKKPDGYTVRGKNCIYSFGYLLSMAKNLDGNALNLLLVQLTTLTNSDVRDEVERSSDSTIISGSEASESDENKTIKYLSRIKDGAFRAGEGVLGIFYNTPMAIYDTSFTMLTGVIMSIILLHFSNIVITLTANMFGGNNMNNVATVLSYNNGKLNSNSPMKNSIIMQALGKGVSNVGRRLEGASDKNKKNNSDDASRENALGKDTGSHGKRKGSNNEAAYSSQDTEKSSGKQTTESKTNKNNAGYESLIPKNPVKK